MGKKEKLKQKIQECLCKQQSKKQLADEVVLVYKEFYPLWTWKDFKTHWEENFQEILCAEDLRKADYRLRSKKRVENLKNPFYTVYCITCKINNKKYIGITQFSSGQRLRFHFNAVNCTNKNKTPLYEDVKRYGKDAFSVTTLQTNIPLDKNSFNYTEQKWIKKLNTIAPKGYNQNIGGVGHPIYISHEEIDMIKSMYNSGFSIEQIAKKLGHSSEYISGLFKKEEFAKERVIKKQRLNIYKRKPVIKIDQKKNAHLFKSVWEAAQSFGIKEKNDPNKFSNLTFCIRSCCNGKRQSAYGYKWKWA